MPDCSVCKAKCGNTDDYDLNNIWSGNDDIRSLKSLILFGIRGMAAYAYHAMILGYTDDEVNFFFYKALAMLSYDLNMEQLLPVVLEVGEVNLKCMELLDKANTSTYGTPAPVKVSLNIEKGPFIVVTGHDLKDLELLLEQTKDKGINIYTHGEMLPAHAYPELKNILISRVTSAQHGRTSRKNLTIYRELYFLQPTALCLSKKVILTEYLQQK